MSDAQPFPTRTSSAGIDFVWVAAPDKYDHRRVLGKRGDGTATPKKRVTPQAEPQQSLQLPPAAPAARQGERTFPLGEGRELVYVMPPDGITTAEVRKLAFHLWTLANDFAPEQGFAMVRAKED